MALDVYNAAVRCPLVDIGSLYNNIIIIKYDINLGNAQYDIYLRCI